MAALASITLADSVPVNHVFSPVGISTEGVALYEDRASGISVGFPRLTASLRRPAKGSSNYRATIKMVLPVLEQTSPSTATGIQPAPTVAYSINSTVEMVIPSRSTLVNRSDALALLKAALASTPMASLIKDYEAVW